MAPTLIAMWSGLSVALTTWGHGGDLGPWGGSDLCSYVLGGGLGGCTSSVAHELELFWPSESQGCTGEMMGPQCQLDLE